MAWNVFRSSKLKLSLLLRTELHTLADTLPIEEMRNILPLYKNAGKKK